MTTVVANPGHSMRIVVAIKQVPETKSVKMDEATGTVIREGVASIINPLDLYAIELALRLARQHDGTVTAVSMGPRKATDALREAVAMGVDQAVLLSDRAFAGADTWATSYVLAAALRRLDGLDLVICGERATDGDTGQVGPGIAAFLDLPVLTYVSGVDDCSNGYCRVRRLVEQGYELLSSSRPCVLTVVKEIGEPRLPTLRGKQRARRLEIPTWGPADLDVEPESLGLAGSPTRVVKIHKPKVTRTCELLRAADEPGVQAAAQRLAAFLAEKELC